jgi:outer membrane receptor protein involved in Fe transport
MKRIIYFCLPLILSAGTVGKISGRIIDAESNETLAGVDVCISAIACGGASDSEGNFFILNIPPGTYEVEASMIGYRSEIKKDVKVYADHTTYVNFSLYPGIIEIDNPVVVVAEEPVIDIDMTSKEIRITRDEIDILPVSSPKEVISIQGGVTTDASGDLHVRGGRTGELAYYIDGIEVSNPLLNSAPQFEKNIISEMSILSGTFNAEYGNVMSGVVNIVTPEGEPVLSSHLEYTSFTINPSPYRRQDWIDPDSATDAHRDSAGNSLYQPPTLDNDFAGEVSAHLTGPVFFDKNSRFYLSGHFLNQESYLPFGYDYGYALNGKLTRRFGMKIKVFIDVSYARAEEQDYNHLYKYLYDNYLVNYSRNIRIIVGVNHSLRNNLFYNMRFGYIVDSLETRSSDLVADTIIEPVYDNYSEFYISGYPIFWQEVITKKYAVKTDITLQTAKIHNIKLGFESNLHRLTLDNRRQLFTRGSIVYQDYEKKPIDGAVYIQDKIEHNYLVMNAGFRFDYYYPDATMWEDIEDPASAVSDVEPRYQLSPRLGLSYPITDNAMFHFAYGHFFQTPPYEIMYFNNNYIAYPESIPQYGLVGNPRVEPQRTTTYEAGVKYALKDIYGIDLTIFLKDIENLLATTEVRSFPYDYIVYTNEDFGSVQGFDITVKRRLTAGFGFSLNYTYQIARGNRSFAMQGFYDVYSGLPERMKEYYLDFDRRHTVAGVLNVSFNELGGAGMNLKASSGLPYTPYISEGVVVEENSARMAWEYSIDIMLHQGFRIGRAVMDVFLKGTNITDHINPLYVYARSGEPWDTGEPAGGLMGSQDYIMDPSHVGPRRFIKAGISIGF